VDGHEAAGVTGGPGRPVAGFRVVGDDVGAAPTNPFHLHFSDGFAAWLAGRHAALAFTTYTAGKVVLVGPGDGGGLVVAERSFGMAMPLLPTATGFHLGTEHMVWRFENALPAGGRLDGWDRIYLPRTAHVSGGVDIHDLALAADGALVAAVTLYNCLATLDARGSFNPIWRPAFVDRIVAEDRCHLNGFCLEDGVPAYVTLTAATNEAGGWRRQRADGGQVVGVRDDRVVASGLAMPHSPRLHRGGLWVVEAGTGWLLRIDPRDGVVARVAWCPGFVRGLRFSGDYALVGLSKPRDRTFAGLPLDGELARRGVEPACGVCVVDLRSGTIAHRMEITGFVEEIYDVALLAGAHAPLLVGTRGEEIARYVFLGPDGSARRQSEL